MIFVLIAIVALVGLPISALLSLGELPDWSVALGPVTAAGGTSSVIFFALFITALVFRSFVIASGVKPPARRSASIAGRMIYATRDLIFLALPVAVVLLWLGA